MQLKRLVSYWINQLVSPGTALRKQYRAFKSLLEHDKQAHVLIAELEEIHHNRSHTDICAIEKTYLKLSACVDQIITDLLTLSPLRYGNLASYFKKFDDYIRLMLTPSEVDSDPPYTLLLDEITIDNRKLVGGKAFNLATVKTALDLPVPEGFVITTHAFHHFVAQNGLRKPIDELLAKLEVGSLPSLKDASRKISGLIRNAEVPETVQDGIRNSLARLKQQSGETIRLAVRSSAVGEDSHISFAGQYLSVLNVSSDEICEAYKRVLASKYSSEALYYRICYGLADTETPMAVLILNMISARASGVIYTHDPEDLDAGTILIHSVPGLGDTLVNGESNPDLIKVSNQPGHAILFKTNATRSEQATVSPAQTRAAGPTARQPLFSLDDGSATILAEWAAKLEAYYRMPQDIEWCKDHHGQLYLLQSRPLITEKKATSDLACDFKAIPNRILLEAGEKAASGIAAGTVFKVEQDSDLESLPPGSILVARSPLPHYVAVLDRLAGVVTDQGSKAGHFSSVAREFGVPVLVNTLQATRTLSNGMEVTIHADRTTVFAGTVVGSLHQNKSHSRLLCDNPFKRRLKFIISFISPLQLTDPQSATFRPEGCRSLHDIIRFSHEMALQEMFSIGDKRSARIRSAKMLKTEIPISFYLLDLGKGLVQGSVNKRKVALSEVQSSPLRHLFKGLNHPGIRWSTFSHFNWEEFDNIVMGGGMISKNSAHLASYAMVSDDYLNLNLRFGYHFVIVDCLCTAQTGKNHLTFRFTGGGGNPAGKVLRTRFLSSVLQQLGFKVDAKGELVDAQLKEVDLTTLEKTLDIVGRLLGATRLMDMYLKDIPMTETAVEEFMNGRYDFTPTDEQEIGSET